MADEELTPSQVARELGVTARTVQRWISSGRLPARQVGARVRVSRSSLSAVGTAGPPASTTPIRSLLIANRGEIAVRIARTAHRLGIRVIGVHAADERPAHGADESHEIDSYLDGEAILAVARRAGADAIHPGYGFLAENAAFAESVDRAGIRWVGPPATAIAAMGDKAAARQRVSEHGVPTIPGYDGEAQDDTTLAEQADRIGYPLLVKPSAGGGGKGMRVVRTADELSEALAAARREAHRSFGDDRLVLERYLAGSRHVEVQVLFDAHGNGVHLGERDCSTQRRNQKVVEEAPAPAVDAARRERMGTAAVAAAAAVGYVSAGTVEMLLADSGEFFFLEMNTRLQVEHPVTEEVTGRDLVADQLRIAQGATLDELGLSAPPTLRGHAIEARVYAEDPEAGFLPATGRLAMVRWPDAVRVDTGVAAEDEVTDRYDPMLAKVIACGRTRAEALDRLMAALDETTILGVRTNVRFLRWLLRQEPMRAGEMRTDTVAGMALPHAPVPGDAHWRAAARVLDHAGGLWSGGWRLNAPRVLRLAHDGEERTVSLDASGDPPSAARVGASAFVDVDGQSLEFRIAPPPTIEEAVRHAARASGDEGALLTAPMPGRVIAIRAREGASVHARETVVVIEAMKMEHAVVAATDGTLTRLMVREGQQVQRGDLLAEVTPAGAYHGGDA
ncbi:MAG TPA: biotin carboxylase N-terminal domain-containing protein [Candidatus Limnocylindria bacterium]|nr:biotin carboxylase N-terminal domain-containing protein [Candidatus Limnocylindria bacterium]